MVVRSHQLDAAASSLHELSSALLIIEEQTGSQIASIEDAVDKIDMESRGPRPDGASWAVRNYVTAVNDAPAILASLRGHVAGYATTAESYAGQLRDVESKLANLVEQRFLEGKDTSDAVFSVLDPERHALESSIYELGEQWGVVSTNYATLIDADTAQLHTRIETMAMGPPYVSAVPTGLLYAGYVAQFTLTHGVPLSLIDPTGELQQQADELLDGIASGNVPWLVFLVMGTANQGDVGDQDGNWSWDDILASTDPAVVGYLIQHANEANDLGLTPEQIAASTDQIVAAAWLIQAAGGNGWEDVKPPENVDPPTSIDEVDMDAVWALASSLDDIEMVGSGVGFEFSGTVGPGAFDLGSAIIVTPANTGQVHWIGPGVGAGSPQGSIGVGTISTNAPNIDALTGTAICISAGGGAGPGGSGSICVSIEQGPNGWRPTGIVSVQGNVTFTTPGASGTVTIVETVDQWQNGWINHVADPAAAVYPDNPAEWAWTAVSPGTFVIHEVGDFMTPAGGLGEQAPGPIGSTEPAPGPVA